MNENLGQFILQQEVVKDVVIDFVLNNTEFDITIFSGYNCDWKVTIDCAFAKKFRVFGAFVSIESYKYLKKEHPYSLWVPKTNIMEWSSYSTLIPKRKLLNPTCIMLPYANILHSKYMIESIFGEHIFIKPNSPWKPFTGFDVKIEHLDWEFNSFSQLEKIARSELVIISDYKQIDNTEFRFWCINEEIITCAPYSWHNELKPIPPEAFSFVEDVLNDIYEHTSDGIVIDIVNTPDGFKVVELNAISTSGWYHGMDVEKLLSRIQENY